MIPSDSTIPTFPSGPGTTQPAFPSGVGMGRPMATDATASGYTPPGESPIDTKSGAPLKVRLAVASVASPVDKLRAIRKFYPDAHPTKYGGFTYTDLTTGRPTTMDESQFTMRDILEQLPGIGELIGAVGGGIAGGSAGLPTFGLGAVPGAMLGSGAGAVAGRELATRALQGITGTADTRPAEEQGAQAAASFGINALGEGVARGITGAVKGGAKGIANLFQITPNAEEQAVKAAGERLGVMVPKVVNTRSRVLQYVDRVLRQNPLTTQTMTGAGERFGAQLGDAAGSIEGQLSGGQAVGKTPFNQTLADAGQGWIDRFKATRNALDDALTAIIPPDTRVPVPNTTQALADLEDEVAKSPNLNWDKLKLAIIQMRKVVDDAAGQTASTPVPGVTGAVDAAGNPILSGVQQSVTRDPGVPFDVLRETRTAVGDQANFVSPLLRKTPEERALSYAYDAMKRDIGAAAEAAGPDAVEVLKMHDAYVQMARDNKQFVNFDTFKKMAEGNPNKDISPLNWALSQTKAGGQKLRSTLDQMLPPERRAVVASVFEDMGRTEQGNIASWDMKQFAKNWAKLGDTRNALFGSPEFRQALPAIQDLVLLTKAGTRAEKLATYTPNTILSSIFGFLGGAATLTHPVAGGVAAISSVAAAQLLTNPTAARLLVNTAKAATWTAAQSARFLMVKKEEPQLADAIDELLQAAAQHGAPMPDLASAKTLNTGRPSLQFEPLP